VTLNSKALGISDSFVVQDLESGPYATQLNAAMDKIDQYIEASGQQNPPGVSDMAKPWSDLVERATDDWDKLEVLGETPELQVQVPARDFRLLVIRSR
jgi:hypothetical protein